MCWCLPLFRISKIATILKTGSYRCNVWRKKRVIPLWYLPAVGVAPFYFFPLFVRCSFFLCLIKTLLFFLCGRVFYTWVKLGCFLVLRSCFVFFTLPKPCHFFRGSSVLRSLLVSSLACRWCVAVSLRSFCRVRKLFFIVL